jgi:hypothetical protein
MFMVLPYLFRKLVISCLLFVLLLQFLGCGTLIHPERRGQTSGRIDPAIAILNGVGLLLFIIPGMLAFAIDFSSGAIYLPNTENPAMRGTKDLVVFHAQPSELTRQRVEEFLAEHTGRTITLTKENTLVREIEGLERLVDEFNLLAAAH